MVGMMSPVGQPRAGSDRCRLAVLDPDPKRRMTNRGQGNRRAGGRQGPAISPLSSVLTASSPPSLARIAGGVRGPTPVSLLDLQRAAGNGAVSALIHVQRALTHDLPTWDPVEGTTGQDTKVVAIVGPGVPMGTGPKAVSNFRPYEYTQLFAAVSKGKQYAQGHLLNENLGGPGNNSGMRSAHAAQNLTAFPQWPTNTDHKSVVEKVVKDNTAAGHWFRYTVQIGYSTDSMPRLLKRRTTPALWCCPEGFPAMPTSRSLTRCPILRGRNNPWSTRIRCHRLRGTACPTSTWQRSRPTRAGCALRAE